MDLRTWTRHSDQTSKSGAIVNYLGSPIKHPERNDRTAAGISEKQTRAGLREISRKP